MNLASPRSQEQVATPAPQNVNHPSDEIEPSSERDSSFNLIVGKQPTLGDLHIVSIIPTNLSSNPLPIESPLNPTLLANNQKPICASAITSILPEQVNSKALPTESTLPGKKSEPQGHSQVIPAVGKHPAEAKTYQELST